MSPAPHNGGLEDRIAHAYYMYGRFCASHKVTCLLASLVTVVFLSSPLRFNLPSSAPMEVFYSTNLSSTFGPGVHRPHWLKTDSSLYIQQVVIRATLADSDNNSSTLCAQDAVKGSLSRAFSTSRLLRDFVAAEGGGDLASACVHVHGNSAAAPLLPHRNCLLLSPALFWASDEERYFKDAEILQTMYESSCTVSMCQRDLLFGMPALRTGVKQFYRTNRPRTVNFAVTVVLHSYREPFWRQVGKRLSEQPGFSVPQQPPTKFVHIYYRTKRGIGGYIPLIFAYVLMFAYFHYNISRIDMVKSKWGLAIAEVFTIASSFTSAAGVCVHFDLIPTMWITEVFPYLALAIGLENTLSITKSVVAVDISKDLRSRIAHGLAREGAVHTKNFLTELVIIVVGFLTFIPDIQEFCTIALVGLWVDFYMQLMFYTPCLGFDLHRVDQDDELRGEIHRRHIRASPHGQTTLPDYPKCFCPVASLLPYFYDYKESEPLRPTGPGAKRARSVTSMADVAGPSHRRATSNVSADALQQALEPRHVFTLQPEKLPRPLRYVYFFWMQRRVIQRLLMCGTMAWISWVLYWAFGSPAVASLLASAGPALPQPSPVTPESGGRETERLEWINWRMRTFKWWPALFDTYNISLHGQYVTMVPPIFLDALIPTDDPAIIFQGGVPDDSNHVGRGEDEADILRKQISFLELRMTMVLYVSVAVFGAVTTFLIWVCTCGRGQSPTTDRRRKTSAGGACNHCGTLGDLMDPVPFTGTDHGQDIEHLKAGQGGLIVSICLAGEVRVWDGRSGQFLREIERAEAPPLPAVRHRRSGPGAGDAFQAVEAAEGPRASAVWATVVERSLILLATANGRLEFWSINNGFSMGGYTPAIPAPGATHVAIQKYRVILVRLNGQLEFLDLQKAPERRQYDSRTVMLEATPAFSYRAHESMAMALETSPQLVATGGLDRTVKLFSLHSGALMNIFHSPEAPAARLLLDESAKALYSSSCEGGLLVWALEGGFRALESAPGPGNFGPLALTTSATHILAYQGDGQLWLWAKSSGSLLLHEVEADVSSSSAHLVLLSDSLAASASGRAVHLWELRTPSLLSRRSLEGAEAVGAVVPLPDGHQIALARGARLFRLPTPGLAARHSLRPA